MKPNTTTTPSEKQAIQEQSQLARYVAAVLEIRFPSKKEVNFRGTVLRKAISELGTIKPTFLVRLYESACSVEFADTDVEAFREACQPAIAKHLGLHEFKTPAAKPATAQP